MIELKNITFSYERREQGGLRNINLTVKNGECNPWPVRRRRLREKQQSTSTCKRTHPPNFMTEN